MLFTMDYAVIVALVLIYLTDQGSCFYADCHLCEYAGGISTDQTLNDKLQATINEGSASCLAPGKKVTKCMGGHTGCGTIYMTVNMTVQLNGTVQRVFIQNVLRTCQFLLREHQSQECWSLEKYDKLIQSMDPTVKDFSIQSLFSSVKDIANELGLQHKMSSPAPTSSPSYYDDAAISGKVCQCETDGCNSEHFDKTTVTSLHPPITIKEINPVSDNKGDTDNTVMRSAASCVHSSIQFYIITMTILFWLLPSTASSLHNTKS